MVIMATIPVQAIRLNPDLINPKYRFTFMEPYRSAHLQIFYGGASSGKSVAIAQRDVFDCINEPRNFLIVRNTANTLRASVFMERIKFIKQLNLSPLFNIRETDLEITYRPRGNKMIFRGLDDVEKLKSITVPTGTITDLRVEEATECSPDAVDELGRRMRGLSPVPKRRVYSFNPIFRTHWICKRHFNGELIKYAYSPEMMILHSTYVDNNFLTDQDRSDIESYTGYSHDVYCKGEWGVLGVLIFTNWEVADLSEKKFDNMRHGLDFGFTNDPSAYVQCSVDRAKKTIYITKEYYRHGATNDQLAISIKPFCGRAPVWCDSAEPKSIAELKIQGSNSISAYPVAKGRDSVWHSIQWLQQHHIVIDRSCTNTINEFQQFQWEKNKAGESINQPVGINDHCIAALRYGTERDRSVRIAIT